MLLPEACYCMTSSFTISDVVHHVARNLFALLWNWVNIVLHLLRPFSATLFLTLQNLKKHSFPAMQLFFTTFNSFIASGSWLTATATGGPLHIQASTSAAIKIEMSKVPSSKPVLCAWNWNHFNFHHYLSTYLDVVNSASPPFTEIVCTVYTTSLFSFPVFSPYHYQCDFYCLYINHWKSFLKKWALRESFRTNLADLTVPISIVSFHSSILRETTRNVHLVIILAIPTLMGVCKKLQCAFSEAQEKLYSITVVTSFSFSL